jgi:GxxExxY protein
MERAAADRTAPWWTKRTPRPARRALRRRLDRSTTVGVRHRQAGAVDRRSVNASVIVFRQHQQRSILRKCKRMDAKHADVARLNELSRLVIGGAFTVLNTLGLEKVYENALVHELRAGGLAVEQQYGIRVEYKGIVVGDYCVDLLAEHDLMVELKAVRALDDTHRLQCVNYLKGTGLHLYLLLNFGRSRLEVKRVVSGL